MANIRKKGRGWEVRWRESGKTKSHIVEGLRADAVEFARETERAIAAKKDVLPGELLQWADLVQRRDDYLKESGRSDFYRRQAKQRMLALGRDRGWRVVHDLTPQNTGDLTIEQTKYLRALLRWAMAWYAQPVNPVVIGRLRVKQSKPKLGELLTRDQIEHMLRVAAEHSPDLHAAGHLVSTYGHRPASLVKLTCAQIADKRLWNMKEKSGRLISHPLLPETLKILKPLVERDGKALLLDYEGKPYFSGVALANAWRHNVGLVTYPKHAGIYKLKKYALSTLLRLTDLGTARSITGLSIQALTHYLETNEKQQQKALRALARR